jgi:hypothetical protein
MKIAVTAQKVEFRAIRNRCLTRHPPPMPRRSKKFRLIYKATAHMHFRFDIAKFAQYSRAPPDCRSDLLLMPFLNMKNQRHSRTVATETHIGMDVPDEIAFPLILRRMAARARVTAAGCWEWTGFILPNGYAEVSFRSRGVRVHRLMYTISRGPIPAGMDVLHSCDNPICFNPTHLSVGVDKQNSSESIARGRRNTARKPLGGWFPKPENRTHCIRGHELVGGNLYMTPNGRRQCRACRGAAARRWKPKPQSHYDIAGAAKP